MSAIVAAAIGWLGSRGLLKSAIRDNDPVVVLENEIMYGESFEVDSTILDPDFTIPLGRLKVERPGSDISIFAFTRNVGFCLQAADILQVVLFSSLSLSLYIYIFVHLCVHSFLVRDHAANSRRARLQS